MSIDRLGMPAAVKHRLVRALPQHASSGAPFVDVWPRGVDVRFPPKSGQGVMRLARPR
jgi:hypothetical protein